MMISYDFNVAALGAILVTIILQSVSLIVYIVKTNGKAQSAHELADKAMKRADDAHASLLLTNANIGLLREKVAGEYPDHDAIKAMEQRLIAEIHRGDGNLIGEIHLLRERLDAVLDRRVQK